MCILLSWIMQRLVFLTYFFSKVIEEKRLGGGRPDTPHLVQEGLNPVEFKKEYMCPDLN